MPEYANTVTARQPYWCSVTDSVDPHRIPAGAPYVRSVAFPETVYDGDRPWTVRVCSDCYCRDGKPMPPPRPRRTP